MKIGIYGGSFNPVTKAHIICAKNAIKELNLDKLIFVPSFINPNKKNKITDNAMHRINMINLVLEEKMEVSDFELKKGGISYTYQSIDYFQKKYNKDSLYLIIGSDNLEKLNKWKNIEEISLKSQIVILKRNKYKKHANLKKYNCLLINNEINNISSTGFLKGNWDFVEPKVRKYIFENFIYIDQILKNTLTQERYIHSVNTAKFALSLAESLNYDKKKAYNAGLMHDIAKEWDKKNSKMFLKKYANISEIDEYKIHQECGYWLLKKVFFSEDEEFNNAIRVHTSLSYNLSLLDKIVFMADKLCIGRKWTDIQMIRNLAHSNFDKAFSLVVIQNRNFIIQKNKELQKDQEIIYEKWSKE
ncbi:MAG: nicotinate-nucleotide adenylyltransferase [Metamycoplasmataceae bacterium]